MPAAGPGPQRGELSRVVGEADGRAALVGREDLGGTGVPVRGEAAPQGVVRRRPHEERAVGTRREVLARC